MKFGVDFAILRKKRTRVPVDKKFVEAVARYLVRMGGHRNLDIAVLRVWSTPTAQATVPRIRVTLSNPSECMPGTDRARIARPESAEKDKGRPCQQHDNPVIRREDTALLVPALLPPPAPRHGEFERRRVLEVEIMPLLPIRPQQSQSSQSDYAGFGPVCLSRLLDETGRIYSATLQLPRIRLPTPSNSVQRTSIDRTCGTWFSMG